MERCGWGGTDPLYVAYHDTEWGFPVADDRRLFEKLCLEGFQSGLSWRTILAKRDNFRAAFANFEFEPVARFGPADIERLLGDAGIVRHRGKIEARQGFAPFLWSYVDGRPLQNRWASLAEVPAETPLSRQISKDLRHAGFGFCGPTIVYAFMQATGLVNDHLVTCPRHAEVARLV